MDFTKLVLFSFISSLVIQAKAVDENRFRIPNLHDRYHRDMTRIKSPQAIHRINKERISKIQNFKTDPSEKRVAWITEEQAYEAHRRLQKNPVTSLEKLSLYDPENYFGFCYGRALFAHLELLRSGVQKEAIKKAFVFGPMQEGDTSWRYHVTTIVKGPGDIWWAIDSIFEKPLALGEWYTRMRKISTNKKLLLYVTNPNRIGPDGWSYNKEGLKNYNNYFEDLFQYLKENPIQDVQKFRSSSQTLEASSEAKSCEAVLR